MEETKKKKIYESQKRASQKYDAKTYDRLTIRLPKGKNGDPGLKERILRTGKSVNQFAIESIKAALELYENEK